MLLGGIQEKNNSNSYQLLFYKVAKSAQIDYQYDLKVVLTDFIKPEDLRNLAIEEMI